MLDSEYSPSTEGLQDEPVAAPATLGPQGELLAQLRSVQAIAQMADVYGQRFVLWRNEPGNRKVPYRLDGRTPARSTDDTTWNTLERCCAALPRTPAGTGLGVILAAERDAANGVLILVGVDLDGCRDRDTGEIEPWAFEIVRAIDSYTEVSPSGTGVKIYLQVERAPELRGNRLVIAEAVEGGKAEQIEIFTDKRYFALTGQHLPDTPATLQVRTAAFAALAARVGEGGRKATVPTRREPAGDAVVAEGGRNDTLFREACRSRHAGHSEAAIEALLLVMNAEQCRPPLDEDEVRAIARSAGRYEPAAKSYEPTEYGVADRFRDEHGGEVRYSDAFGWMGYDGARWAGDGAQEVQKRAQETIRGVQADAEALPEDDADQGRRKKAALGFAYRMQTARVTKAILDLAKAPLAVRMAEFDRDPYLFNIANGTLDLRTCELRPHSRDDLLRKIAPVAYDPDAKAPTFDRFMLDITDGDRELVAFLLRLFGSALPWGTGEQMMAVFHGGGRNGKSTLTALMNDLFGDYAVQATDDLLMERKQDGGVPNDVARLAGVRLVTADETKDGRRLDAAKIKRLLGGEKVAARFLKKEFFEFVPGFVPVLSTNHMPLTDGGDFGIMRRVLMCPFDVRIAANKVDKELPAKLRREMPGVLARVVRGYRDYRDCRAGGLEPPARVLEATEEFRESMDTLGEFFGRSGKVEFGPGLKVEFEELLHVYRVWMLAQHQTPMTRQGFGRRVTQRLQHRDGVKKHKSNGRMTWTGMGLKEGALGKLGRVA